VFLRWCEGQGITRKGPLFRAAIGKTKKLGPRAISRTDVWYMVRRRAADASATLYYCQSILAILRIVTDFHHGLLSLAQDNCSSYRTRWNWKVKKEIPAQGPWLPQLNRRTPGRCSCTWDR
jgi:hypothetical protein